MLSPTDRPSALQRWYDRLVPLIAGAQDRLRQIPPARLIQRTGCDLHSDGSLRLCLFWREYRIQPPAFGIQQVSNGQPPSDFTQALILTYLVSADGTPPSGPWITYRDLPGGMFYAQAFHGYAEIPLIRDLGADGVQAFHRASQSLGGAPVELGNAAYAFQVLPHVRLAAVYWQGDEELESQASVLFECTAPHYLSTDGLAVLGSHLVSAIVAAASDRRAKPNFEG
jgi:Domain of unknown function (DUF3786)